MSCTTGFCAAEGQPPESGSKLEVTATLEHQGIIGAMLENGVKKGASLRLVIPKGAEYTRVYEVSTLVAQAEFRVTGEVASIGSDHITLIATAPMQDGEHRFPALGMWQFYTGGISKYEELVPKQSPSPSQ